MHATNTNKGRMLKVVAPIEKKDGTTFWLRVGTGYPGKDPSTLNLFIDAFPTGNVKMLHVREMEEEDLQPRKGRRGGGGGGPDLTANPGNDDLPF